MPSRAPQGKPRTPEESHCVVLARKAVPSGGQLDVSEQLTDGQGNNVRIIAVLWRDGQCIRSQLVVKVGRACQGVGVVIEECNDLREVA